MSTALAIKDDQEFWDDRQLAVLYSTGIDQDVSKPELAAFLHECQRRKLDPFAKQIYLLGRYNRQAGRKVYRSQTSIDGFRVIARRAADKAGVDYGYEGTIWFDGKGGRHEVWLDPRPPAAAKVVVIRNGQRFDAVASYAEYVQVDKDGNPSGLWKSMPAGQTSKCAEALALRKAFPEDLGGLYTDDEMAQADNPQTIQATAGVVPDEPARPTRPASGTRKASTEPPSAPTVTADAPLGDVRGAWYDSVLERAGTVTEDTYKALWTELSDGQKSGMCTTDERKQAEALIAARMDDLRNGRVSDDVVEGVIVPESPAVTGFEPGDPWAANIESISSSEDAETAIADVQQAVRNKSMTRARADQIIAAIGDRKQFLLTQATRGAA